MAIHAQNGVQNHYFPLGLPMTTASHAATLELRQTVWECKHGTRYEFVGFEHYGLVSLVGYNCSACC
jgi:hypothetical protein